MIIAYIGLAFFATFRILRAERLDLTWQDLRVIVRFLSCHRVMERCTSAYSREIDGKETEVSPDAFCLLCMITEEDESRIHDSGNHNAERTMYCTLDIETQLHAIQVFPNIAG